MPGTIIRERSGPGLKRHKDIRLLLKNLEPGRHHADNGITVVIQCDGLAEHAGRRRKPPFPETMADDRHRWRTRLIFRIREAAAQFRLDSQQVKKIGGNILRGQPFGFGSPRHRHQAVPYRSYRFKGMALIAPVFVIEIGDVEPGELRPTLRKQYESLRITIWKRPK